MVGRLRRCPACRTVMRRVHISRKYLPHYHCRKCHRVLGEIAGELVNTPIAEFIRQTGVAHDGRVLNVHQAHLYAPEITKAGNE